MKHLLLVMLLALMGCQQQSAEVPVSSRPIMNPKPFPIGVLADLPDDLQYLTEPAIKYGGYQYDDEMVAFLDQATEEEMSDLRAVAANVLENGHYPRVNEFLRQYPITEYDETARLYFLFGVMDCADLQFDAVDE